MLVKLAPLLNLCVFILTVITVIRLRNNFNPNILIYIARCWLLSDVTVGDTDKYYSIAGIVLADDAWLINKL
jgi:hypothetical protein